MKNTKKLIYLLLLMFWQNSFAYDASEKNLSIKFEKDNQVATIVNIKVPEIEDVSVPANIEMTETLLSMDKKIKNAKEISINKIKNSSVEDGIYKIEYLLEGKKYEVQNDEWIYESGAKKFYRCHILNELRTLKEINEFSNYYENYFIKETLNANDCENLDFIKWLLKYESGLDINNKNVEIIKTQYSNGIPVQITQLPYYYKVKITQSEYNQFKKDLKKNHAWKIQKNGQISLLLVTKFCLSCTIKKDELIFGFGNIDIIYP